MGKIQGIAVMSSLLCGNRAIVVFLLSHWFQCAIDKSNLPVEKLAVIVSIL